MKLLKQVIRQRDFSGGEVDDTAQRRDDAKIFGAALRRGLNLRPLDTGAATRRPGRKIRYFDGGQHDIVRPVTDIEFDVTFADGRFTARLIDGAIVSEILGCPWTTAMLNELSWEEIGRRIFVAHRLMPPQVLAYSADTGAWTIFPFSFRSGLNGALRGPFYRFADYGETMQPDDTNGTIEVETSADVFVAGHVGTRFTYVDRQIEITAVTDARHATAEVIEELPPSYRVNLNTISGFVVGEIVQGNTSNAKGEVVEIGTTFLDVVMTENFAGFTNTEIVVGLNGRGTVSSSSGIAPLPTIQWEEAFMSPVRGYPGSVSTVAQRVVFTDFPQFDQAILMSAIAALDDFFATGEADGAIFEYVPQRGRVLYVIEGADVFVITDRGVYYIPISGASPLAPGSVEFRKISTDGAAHVRPVPVPDGLMFVNRTKKRLSAIVATGQTARPYVTRSLSDFHTHLFTEVISIAASDGNDTFGGRYAYAVNADGSVVAGRYDEQADWMGWFPWSGEGRVTAVAARYGEVIFSVAYDLVAGLVETVEGLDGNAVMDGMLELSGFIGSDPFQDSTGDAIDDSTGAPFLAVFGALVPFAGLELDGWADGFYLGKVAIDIDGSVEIDAEELGLVSLGFNFDVEASPLIPGFEGGQDMGQRLRKRKVAKALATVRNTTVFEADGHVFAGFDAGDEMETARPERDETYRWRQLGRSYDPEINLGQTVPGKFTLIELTAEITV